MPQSVDVFLGIDLAGQVQPEQKLVVHVVRESLGGQQNKPCGLAGAQFAAPTVK